MIPWDLLTNVEAASVTSAVLGAIGLALTVDGLRWDKSISTRQHEHSVITDRVEEFYAHRPRPQEWDFYSLVPELALNKVMRTRYRRLLARSRHASDLEQYRHTLGCEFARKWAKTVGAMAHEFSRTDRVPLRRLLQTYHLTLIREGSIALPFIVCMASRNELDNTERDYAACGVALMELAASYNSIARQQRSPVYFDVKGMPPIGPVVRAPRRRSHVMLNVRDYLHRNLRLREGRVAAARNRLDRLAADLRTSMPGQS